MSSNVDQLPAFVESPAPAMTEDERLRRASARVRNYCGWHIFPEVTETLVLDGRGGRVLMLPTLMLTAVASIVIDGSELAETAWRKSRRGMLERVDGYGWPVGFETIQVTITHGYDQVPEDLPEVVVGIATRLPVQMQMVTSETADKVSLTYGGDLAGGFSGKTGLTIVETNILDTYRVEVT